MIRPSCSVHPNSTKIKVFSLKNFKIFFRFETIFRGLHFYRNRYISFFEFFCWGNIEVFCVKKFKTLFFPKKWMVFEKKIKIPYTRVVELKIVISENYYKIVIFDEKWRRPTKICSLYSVVYTVPRIWMLVIKYEY